MNTHRKGSVWRLKVEKWLGEAGFKTLTRGIGYAGDDIYAALPLEHYRHEASGLPSLTLRLSIEAKNDKSMALASFVDQAVRQAESYGDDTLPVAVIHRRGRDSVDGGYVVMPGWAFIELVTR